MPAWFIRLAGCNLNCDFCDTPTKNNPGKMMSINDILAEVGISKIYHVVITGGEPTIHKAKLAELVFALQCFGKFVAIETNGTSNIWFNPDWITVSPKPHSNVVQLCGNELKVLFLNREYVDGMHHLAEGFEHLYVQPVERDGVFLNIPDIMDFVKENPKWRVSVQLHKILVVR